MFAYYCSLKGRKAEFFPKFDPDSGYFDLIRGVLNEISKLPSFIPVITFLGNAKAGKSTALNTIIHVLIGSDQKRYFRLVTLLCLSLVTSGFISFIHKMKGEGGGGGGEGLLYSTRGSRNKSRGRGLSGHLSLFSALNPSDVNVFVRDLTITTCTFCFACVILFSRMFMKKALPHSKLL